MFQTARLDSDNKNATFLDYLPEAERKLLADASELRSFSHGEQVFAAGDMLQGAYVVSDGALKLTRATSKDKVQVLDLILPGQCIGEAHVFTKCAIASKAEAYGDTECLFVPGDALRKITSSSPAVSEAIIKYLAGKMLNVISLAETLGLRTVPQRVAQMIVNHANMDRGEFEAVFFETQTELSHYIGCSREGFNRALRLLTDLGLIRNEFPVICILEPSKLQQYFRH
jgi:CRP/FNR family transcriptional regulator